MKPFIRVLAAVLSTLMLGGCAKSRIESDQPEPEAVQPQSETHTEVPITSQQQTASESEPEVWEEEWPEEYVVKRYRLAEGAVSQTGDLNKYRYTPLDGADRYKDIVALYLFNFLGEDFDMEEDSPHDGYANWFMTGESCSASVSGSSITGRFSYSLQPDFDRILQASSSDLTNLSTMEKAARDFTVLFSEITGELELLNTDPREMYYPDQRTSEMKDVVVPAMVYTFRSREYSRLDLEIQNGLRAPVTCGDSEIADLNVHCFKVTVWPDGTVIGADNYITRAGVTADGVTQMLGTDNLSQLLNFFTSTTEYDTVVFESICADHFSVYFGGAEIEPSITVEYHFDSEPDEHFSTKFVLPGLFDPV